MTLVYRDRVKETSATTGTDAYELDGAVTGFQAFSVIGDGNTCYYCATDGTDWEVALGTLSGTSLERTAILASSNGDAAVDWSGSGPRVISLDLPAAVFAAVALKTYVDDAVSGKIGAVQDDTAPKLGGDLDLNGADVTGTGNIDIDGDVTPGGKIVGNNGGNYPAIVGDETNHSNLAWQHPSSSWSGRLNQRANGETVWSVNVNDSDAIDSSSAPAFKFAVDLGNAQVTFQTSPSGHSSWSGDTRGYIDLSDGTWHFSAVIKQAGNAVLDTTAIDPDSTFAANSDDLVPSQKAVKAAINGLLAAKDAVVLKGAIDCSGNPNYPAADAGDEYRVSVAGKIGGASGAVVEAGDVLLCWVDSTASGNQATVGANWAIIQLNIDGAVTVTNLSTTIHGATSKGTPVDADELGLADSGDSWSLKKLTWANLKATLKTYLDTLYQAVGSYAASGANTDITSIALNQTGLTVKGASANKLTIKPNETLSAGRTLSIVTGNADRSLTFTGDASISGTNTGDQTNVTGNAGTATKLATARSIYGNNFDGTTDLSAIIAATYGGTGNGFAKFAGPATSEKTFTLPDSNAAIAALDLAGQAISGGAEIAPKDLGTKTSGTLTVNPADCPWQKVVHGAGAFALDVAAHVNQCILELTNSSASGSITTSAFDLVDGDPFDNTAGSVFLCLIAYTAAGKKSLSVRKVS
jgi:hypothetical protein